MTNNDKNTRQEIAELENRLEKLKNQTLNESTGNKNSYLTPLAIVVAGILVAGSVFYAIGSRELPKQAALIGKDTEQTAPARPKVGSPNNIKPVSSEDHIFGDPDAPVKLVEFSDLECPFCKRFHPTMKRLMEEYGESGQVAWIYRHFPLDPIHPKARIEAAATELAGELGGNEKFWEYVDKIFEITPSNNRLDLTLLPKIAEDIGLDGKAFEKLISEGGQRGGAYAEHIESDYQDAISAGGTGTPYSVIIAPNGKKFPLSGAQPYSAVKSLIELALREK